MDQKEVKVGMLVVLPVEVTFTRRADCSVRLPSGAEAEVDYEDLVPLVAETEKTFTQYRWTWKNGGGVEEVECMPTGKRQYVLVLDPEDTMGGTIVYLGSLYESAEECWDASIKEAQERAVSAEKRVAELIRKRDR